MARLRGALSEGAAASRAGVAPINSNGTVVATALPAWEPQADVRRLGCWDLRQSAAFKTRLFRRNVSYNKGPLTRVHTSKPALADWLLALHKTAADVI